MRLQSALITLLPRLCPRASAHGEQDDEADDCDIDDEDDEDEDDEDKDDYDGVGCDMMMRLLGDFGQP